MRVLHVYKAYLPEDFAGVSRVIYSVAEGLAGAGVETQVLVPAKRVGVDRLLQIDNHFVRQAKRSFKMASMDFSLEAFSAFREMITTCDVVHYHFPWPVADLFYLLDGWRRPSVVTYHSDIIKQKNLLLAYGPLMHAFLSRVGSIVATSDNYVRTSPVLQKYQGKIDVIPIGIGPRPAVRTDVLEKWKERLGAAFFLFVGAARYYKGIDFLLQAAKLNGLPVVLAGEIEESQRNGLPENVTALGPVSDNDKEALLDLCAGFVFPSHVRSEAFGVALLEAARAGKPMICCEIGTGTSFVNIDGETGIVVAPENAMQLAEAMRKIANDPEISARMGAHSRRRFETLFTQDQMAAAYLDIYRKVLDVKR